MEACSARPRFLICLDPSTSASTASGRALAPPLASYSQAFLASMAINCFSKTVLSRTCGRTALMNSFKRGSGSAQAAAPTMKTSLASSKAHLEIFDRRLSICSPANLAAHLMGQGSSLPGGPRRYSRWCRFSALNRLRQSYYSFQSSLAASS